MGQGDEQCFCPSESTLVQICLCLTSLRVYGANPNLSHVKDPISICRKRVDLAAGVIGKKDGQAI